MITMYVRNVESNISITEFPIFLLSLPLIFHPSTVETVEAAGPRAIAHDGRQAAACAKLIGALCVGCEDDFQEYVPMMLQSLLPLLNGRFECTLDAALDALESCVNAIEKEDLPAHVPLVHKTIHSMCMDHAGEVYLHAMPAFSRPKGLVPLWPLYQHGLLYGSADVRAQVCWWSGVAMMAQSGGINGVKTVAKYQI
jgi:hypothetical protein